MVSEMSLLEKILRHLLSETYLIQKVCIWLQPEYTYVDGDGTVPAESAAVSYLLSFVHPHFSVWTFHHISIFIHRLLSLNQLRV